MDGLDIASSQFSIQDLANGWLVGILAACNGAGDV